MFRLCITEIPNRLCSTPGRCSTPHLLPCTAGASPLEELSQRSVGRRPGEGIEPTLLLPLIRYPRHPLTFATLIDFIAFRLGLRFSLEMLKKTPWATPTWSTSKRSLNHRGDVSLTSVPFRMAPIYSWRRVLSHYTVSRCTAMFASAQFTRVRPLLVSDNTFALRLPLQLRAGAHASLIVR